MVHEEASPTTYYRLVRALIYALAIAAALPILFYASGYNGHRGEWAAEWIIFRLIGSPLLLLVTGGILISYKGRIHTLFGLLFLLLGLSWIVYVFSQDL